MFVSVVKNKLYLESNFDKLQKFKHQVSVELKQSQQQGRARR